MHEIHSSRVYTESYTSNSEESLELPGSKNENFSRTKMKVEKKAALPFFYPLRVLQDLKNQKTSVLLKKKRKISLLLTELFQTCRIESLTYTRTHKRETYRNEEAREMPTPLGPRERCAELCMKRNTIVLRLSGPRFSARQPSRRTFSSSFSRRLSFLQQHIAGTKGRSG